MSPGALGGEPVPRNRFACAGSLRNVNTLEDFSGGEARRALGEAAAAALWEAIVSGEAERDASLLGRFAVLCHADLKKWKFYHWFCYPCFALERPAELAAAAPLAAEEGEEARCEGLCAAVLAWRGACAAGEGAAQQEIVAPAAFTCGFRRAAAGASAEVKWERLDLAAVGEAFHSSDRGEGLVLAAFDPCASGSDANSAAAGWPVRNLLALAAARWVAPGEQPLRLRLLCVRERRGVVSTTDSVLMDVEVPPLDVTQGMPKALFAWERNAKGKAAPRVADLGAIMDPERLAEQAADLNLKLMRWRVLPELDTDALRATRCLLLGAGTLGCAVARGLLAWGVRTVTFTDCARVSYSNPVRQSLYSFEDCKGGGRPKAQAAAEALRAIFPGTDARHEELTIPMPGHPVGEEDSVLATKALQDAARLRALIESHDAVFVLTDTRESRWLPTLLCAALGRPLFNTALGFDSYVVMRHGAAPVDGVGCPPCAAAALDEAPRNLCLAASGARASAGSRLGCYFCNDVVAPLDSTRHRTLDQQCTVTRPGLAPIAGALAVEMLVAMVHHPDGAAAPASGGASGLAAEEVESKSPLGALAHQLRGFLGSLQQLPVAGAAYDRCTACSESVVDAYRRQGDAFLLRAFNEPSYLEELTGLAEMKRAAEGADCAWDGSDGEMSGDDW